MSRPVVVITDSNLPDAGIPERILGAGGFAVRRAACKTAQDVLTEADGAAALIVQWAPIDQTVLDRLQSCRFISRLGIGVDMIDLAHATARGIAVANVPDYCVEEVVTHTASMILAGARRIVELDAAVRAGRWSVTSDAPNARRPSATTVGVIGFGRIGSSVAASVAALGFNVLAHDPVVEDAVIEEAGCTACDLTRLLAGSDIVTMHVPLTDATHRLLDAPALATLPRGAYVVNTGRGALIDEVALADALRTGHLSGAALDVFETEPLPDDSPLRSAPNLIATPHAAWYSPQSMADLPVRAAEQIVDFFEGRDVASILNPAYRERASSQD